MQFIGYHIDGFNRDKSIPVSTGATRDEAQGLAITRILSMGVTDGEIGVQANDRLTAEEFASLGAMLDEWFAEKGVPRRRD